MVSVVQLVEHQVVILGVAGSSPVTHPTGRRVFSFTPKVQLATRFLGVCVAECTFAKFSRQVLALPAFHTGQGMFQSPSPSVPGSVDPTVLVISTMSPLLLWS